MWNRSSRVRPEAVSCRRWHNLTKSRHEVAFVRSLNELLEILGSSMESIKCALTLWNIGLISSDAVIAWADEQILASSSPAYELLELSADGPEACLKRPERDFSARPRSLSFVEQLSALALASDASSDAVVLGLARWAAHHAMGEDLDDPFVVLSYRLDHLLNDCNELSRAVQLLRAELPLMLPRCRSIAIPLLGQVPSNSFKPPPLRGAS